MAAVTFKVNARMQIIIDLTGPEATKFLKAMKAAGKSIAPAPPPEHRGEESANGSCELLPPRTDESEPPAPPES